LKPVRLADLNRLKPHMMKTKIKNEKQEDQEKLEKSEIQSEQQQQPLQPQPQPQPESQSQPQPSPLLQQPNNNKRKAMEEGLSPDRTRPRYNGITTMV